MVITILQVRELCVEALSICEKLIHPTLESPIVVELQPRVEINIQEKNVTYNNETQEELPLNNILPQSIQQPHVLRQQLEQQQQQQQLNQKSPENQTQSIATTNYQLEQSYESTKNQQNKQKEILQLPLPSATMLEHNSLQPSTFEYNNTNIKNTNFDGLLAGNDNNATEEESYDELADIIDEGPDSDDV